MRSARNLAAACALLLSFAVPVAAQQTIFVVRHAERADTPAPGAVMTAPANDPPLSAAGHERAARLATALRSADIKYIFTTEFVRTKQTAAPTAKAQSLESAAVTSKDATGLITRVSEAKGNVLVVGHSNSVPEILKRLGVKEPITIAETEFDNLFVVVRPAAGEPTLIRLRY